MKLGIQICKLSACLHAISFSGFPSSISTSFFMRFDEEDHSCHKYILIGEKSPKTTDIIFDLFCHHHGILQRCNLLTMMPACNTVV